MLIFINSFSKAEDEIDLAVAHENDARNAKYSVAEFHDGADALFYAESTPWFNLADVMMKSQESKWCEQRGW